LCVKRALALIAFMDVLDPFDEQEKEQLAGVVADRMAYRLIGSICATPPV
jgi:hypothetical protein